MTTYYKTLIDGKSFHGGEFKYSLPKLKKDGTYAPGKWHKHDGDIVMCESGFHVTSEPTNWWQKAAKCYEAEYRGDVLTDPDSDKICVSEVRLIREVPPEEVQIFYSGTHTVTSGVALAYDSATIKACDSATVMAYDSATIKACDLVTIEAYGAATIEAHDSVTIKACDLVTIEAYGAATIEAYGSATVEAYGAATVKAHGSSTVEAHGSVTVKAHGLSTVEAHGSATVNSRLHKGTVTLNQDAVHINRDTNPPTVRGNFQIEEAK